ncbi:recombinase family protein [Streptomyces sp. NPDC047028]|uniref:recombinase family protein n=1 Tax=Streptomyces sp. NPDC047028 TaxID=3155793 RepID=UPI0033E94E40
MDYARSGDTLCVWKLDCFARSLIDLVTMVNTLRDRGIGFKELTSALADIAPGTADGRLMASGGRGHGGVRAQPHQGAHPCRTDAARAQGRIGGRPSVVDEDAFTLTRAREAKGESVSAKALGISRATLYRHLGEGA